jgi:hypothetical protein
LWRSTSDSSLLTLTILPDAALAAIAGAASWRAGAMADAWVLRAARAVRYQCLGAGADRYFAT